MDPWITIIAQVGFPIGVAVFLLVRLEKRLELLTEAVHAMKEATLACSTCPLRKHVTIKGGSNGEDEYDLGAVVARLSGGYGGVGGP